MEKRIISVFSTACEPILTHNDFRERRRIIKDLFVKRDYLAIFTNPDLTDVYVAEYSPSRALCYHQLFSTSPTLSDALQSAKLIYSIGAGSGGELAGITAALNSIRPSHRVTIHSQDIADYSSAIIPLEAALLEEFKHASVDSQTSCFNILSTEPLHVQQKSSLVSKADIITSFFILNELLANSKKEFVQFVKLLVTGMKPGALLVVVDSAGSFSEVNVGKKGGKAAESSAADTPPSTYMVYNLLDAIQAFEVVEKSDSQWYRYPEGLYYPIKLNNMRHFLRVYRKI
ncbi:hypothetical protein BCR33DRAFT_845589 [Rhizoclosmatium globosum]|uniref:S-adenosyl-L-methionine-dependent methyltransferase n=1 Tax=Rhizoclosmatium globosum TaxID=329046 RepID=A0A1Y2CZX0_9FUNG|nr:hypothetical protein HDU79_003668 [Rhizoclosmatium sp. JEL0117]ORY52414.1 hypothetical protein BCR33DRAFT_845589 [Rhizoclosmatium globosum]|eukprot:ORY52414.1 hypothetical protein BCR33DRAFT_845589 [Rhizoclosmatium globosum]